ncbi:hypothetical protein H7J88_20710 [Mycolicibacterium flavescens]|uniref:Uncharacterized protein n=1 Tax=Mycolicibacterium flavescens TaxID=1776 RepID=A0A1E3RAP6_MYCFV|nr:hypothetical protein [Mycolicibacterium flavescens]MCV7282055.1 hypothetical protein [Mycolicibacterium flavescens]ODQ86462.1 hypothetical protein BHQ18_26965 [Mycolicibacterium flavescens]
MNSVHVRRRIAVLAGGAAALAMVMFTASCAQEETPEETTTTTTTEMPSPTSSPTEAPVEPTDKAPRIDPGGPNPFSPTVIAPPAPTAPPGDN